MSQKINFTYINKLNVKFSISYNLNIPSKLKNKIEIFAKKNNKSINSEIQDRLENSFNNPIDFFSTDDLESELKIRNKYDYQASRLKKYLESIEKKIHNNNKLNIFPTKKQILNQEVNLNLIIKHGNNILNNFDKYPLDFIDQEYLFNIFIKHIHEYFFHAKIKIPEISLGLGQEYITPKSLYHIARHKLFHKQYINIELHDSQYFELYTIPFILRLCIETKIKSIIGFESLKKLANNKPITTSDIPVKDVLRLLSESKIIDFPIKFNSLINIYDWSCQFTHNANKENIWITLEALDILNPIFSYTDEKNRSNSGFDENRVFHEYLNYLKPNFDLIDLENEINNSKISKEKKYEFKLNKEKLGSAHPIYNKIKGIYI